jgi:hypothetical protein
MEYGRESGALYAPDMAGAGARLMNVEKEAGYGIRQQNGA